MNRMDEVKWLMAREIPRLRRYALTLADDPQAADDLVQDCLERAIRKRHQWKRHGSIRYWLYRILYHVFINQTSQRNRTRQQLDIDEVSFRLSEAPRQEDHVMCSDIAVAMRMLPADQRAAITLVAVEGMSYDEAAAILDVPIGTVRSRLARGREKLRYVYRDGDDASGRPALRRVK
jgi:RNA polymerase sigma-70 factor (ECF subfamily)